MEISEEEQTEIIRGYFDRKKVYLPLTEKTKEFREKGFGVLKRKRIYLSPLESLYLLDKKRIMIYTQNKVEITLYDLVKKLTIKIYPMMTNDTIQSNLAIPPGEYLEQLDYY